jgi:hypothetical protein
MELEDRNLMNEIKQLFKESNERMERLMRGELRPDELKEIKAAQRKSENLMKDLRKRLGELAQEGRVKR